MLEGFVTFLKKEWGNLRKAPFAFVMLSALCLSVGFGGGMLYYSSQVGSLREQISAKDGQLGRYRVALGIDPASKGALVELNNEELALKAQASVAKLRKLSSVLKPRFEGIQKQLDAGKINQDQALTEKLAAMQEAAQDFEGNLASDAHNVDNELRRRLDPKAIAHVVRVPGFIDSEGTRLPFTEILKGSGIDTFYIPGLADEIEQMAKLLPPDSAKKQ
jgi:hypothetical protein